jgi:hypothetical protein
VKTGTLLAIIIFIVVALAHLYRLISGAEILLNGEIIPQWISIPGVLVPGLVVWLLWKESKQ